MVWVGVIRWFVRVSATPNIRLGSLSVIIAPAILHDHSESLLDTVGPANGPLCLLWPSKIIMRGRRCI